jgi:hypothetical protein
MDVVDAEVVEETAASAAGSVTFNEPSDQPDGPTENPNGQLEDKDNGSVTFDGPSKVDLDQDRPALPKEEN